MLSLDCESRASALDSLASIFGLSEKSIENFLCGFDIEDHYKRNEPPHSGDRELRLVLETRLRCSAAPLDRVYWFHLTRALPTSDFAHGIQPLTTALDHVWETVLHVFHETQHQPRLTKMKELGVPNSHYQLKTAKPLHAGPYAMLVRDVANRSKDIGNHDYLWLPEIMEDICNGYQTEYGESIHDELNKALVPVIVKFWSAKQRGIGCVEAALYYVYLSLHGHKLTMHANTCFDGKNELIPREQIIRVEKAMGEHDFVPTQ